MSAYVRSRKFCCCLPVRSGVFALSLIAMVGGSFVAAIGWIEVSQLSIHPMEKADEVALWIHSGMFTILGALAVLGFIGALIKNRAMVSTFAVALAVHLGFSVASGVFTLYSVFRQNPQDAIAKCLNDAAGNTEITTETCQNGIAIMKGIMVAIYIVTWFIQLYAYFVVERYADQLGDEEIAENTIVFPRTVQEISAPQITTYNGFASSYPFTAPGQAHGVTRGQDPSDRV
ncbi:hypothetical protein M413DRAFT_385314 [Hebeloma cylindrosporum]|uniref:Uncharacterized protein n=1 Tax=Hebeloma cylindrosporum TaxID=76867 RepID=A0A0C3C455_HEBCY|nr:hypothetical protein M413DRAFT_385314 [Hebeloma cylindrosporum h7]